jgi:hypothetical protein
MRHLQVLENFSTPGSSPQSDRRIASMLKRDLDDLNRTINQAPAFKPNEDGSQVSGSCLTILQSMRRLIDKYTVEGDRGQLVLKSEEEIRNYW